ncbi:hypothetical protein T439DRAFT_329955 [Meredithblackwellia eburnea MCA 4105]
MSTLFSDPTTDPRDTALSPWVWVPLSLTAVACFVFVSVRRAHSLRIWGRIVDWYDQHSPFTQGLRLVRGGRGGIRLGSGTTSTPNSSRPRRPKRSRTTSSSTSEPDSEQEDREEDSASDPGEDDDDELPSVGLSPTHSSGSGGYPASIVAKTKNGVMGVLDTLGWTGGSGGGGGLKRAFWGTRRVDRPGGIRLGDEEERIPSTSSTKPQPRRPKSPSSGTGNGNGSGILRPQPLPPPSATPNPPPSPKATRSPSANLFDLGEEDEDADELGNEFILPAEGGDHPLAQGGEVNGIRGMQRMT